jgi:hypothetical protein
MTLGVTDGSREFGRCLECSCDLVRSGQAWKRLPKGFKLVSEPVRQYHSRPRRQTNIMSGSRVNLHDVTVVGERTYGDQRFALVRLDGSHSVELHSGRDIFENESSYAHAAEPIALFDPAPLAWTPRQSSTAVDVFDLSSDDDFDWERAYTGRI